MAAATRAVAREEAQSGSAASHGTLLLHGSSSSPPPSGRDLAHSCAPSLAGLRGTTPPSALLLSPRTPDPRPPQSRRATHQLGTGCSTADSTPPPEPQATKVLVATRSRRHKRPVTSSGDPPRSATRSSHAVPSKVLKLNESDDVPSRRRGAGASGSLSVQSVDQRQQVSRQRLAETLNVISLFSIVRRLATQSRKSPALSQRTRLLPAHQGSMFHKPPTIPFPPGALPENLVVWVRCVRDMPAQSGSVAATYPWHLGKILYVKPAPGYALGYVHSSGLPEDVNAYLMEWAVAGHSQQSSSSHLPHHNTQHDSSLSSTVLRSLAPKRTSQSLQPSTAITHRASSDVTLSSNTATRDTAASGDSNDVVDESPTSSNCRLSQDSAVGRPPEQRLIVNPCLGLEAVVRPYEDAGQQGVVAAAPWQFQYYIHYQGYNRRYDRWVGLSELLPSILDPQTARVSSAAVARHLVSAMHSLGHPTWKQYTSEASAAYGASSSAAAFPDPHSVFEPKLSDDAPGRISSHSMAALLAVRLLCSVPYKWAAGQEGSRARRDSAPLLEWCASFLRSSLLHEDGPAVTSLEERALLWVSQLLFSRFQLDVLDLHAAALRASKKKRKTGGSFVSSSAHTNGSTPSDSDTIWSPLCATWAAAVDALEHCRGVSSTLLNDKTRSLTSTWETAVLPSRSLTRREDGLKPAVTQLLSTVIGEAVRRTASHRLSHLPSDSPLMLHRNYSGVSAYDDVHSDAGEHEGIDNTSIEAHEAMTKLRTIDTLQIDNYIVPTWYYSPFPRRFHPAQCVFICGGCLQYFLYEPELRHHEQVCSQFTPPGDEIYRDGRLSFFQVDGEIQPEYCENLSLMSKLFLDHKTLQYSVTPFLFYILVEWDDAIQTSRSSSEVLRQAGVTPARNNQLVGYFSKEKVSSMGYNLACILTLPQHQRKGYGKYFMHFSYSLSKIEGKTGTPERPLSDLGRVSYTRYWKQTLASLLLSPLSAPPPCNCTFSQLTGPLAGVALPTGDDAAPYANLNDHGVPYCAVLDTQKSSAVALDKRSSGNQPAEPLLFFGELPASVDDIAHFTAMRREDIIATLQMMGVLRKDTSTGEYVIVFDVEELQQKQRSWGQPPAPIRPSQFLWTPWCNGPSSSNPDSSSSSVSLPNSSTRSANNLHHVPLL